MDKNTLYKYFEGIASPEEEAMVHSWLNASPANKETLLKEREFFDVMILSESPEIKPEVQKVVYLRPWIKEMLKIAAIVAVTVACGFYFGSTVISVN